VVLLSSSLISLDEGVSVTCVWGFFAHIPDVVQHSVFSMSNRFFVTIGFFFFVSSFCMLKSRICLLPLRSVFIEDGH
jgi:hypothetical protein